jgi:prepilin-type processing-associated H-X9-DG protein
MTHRYAAAGFTLVELVTVAALLALLTASLLATFTKGRDKANQSTCQENLKQLALAVHQYTQDHDSRFPPAGYVVAGDGSITGQLAWPAAIQSYVKNDDLFLCPTQKASTLNLDYGFDIERLNERLAPAPLSGFRGQLESKIGNSALIWLNSDSLNGSVLIDVNACAWCPIRETLHYGGADYSFVDGHVKWMTPDAATCLEVQNGAPW